MPSRMTCAQLIEALLGSLCAIKGTHFDGTMFKKVDIESIAEELEQYGYNRYGYERMISGITGEYMDTLIFFGPTFYQRLQKFVADAEYSVRHALTDAVTLQPLDQVRSKWCVKTLLVCVWQATFPNSGNILTFSDIIIFQMKRNSLVLSDNSKDSRGDGENSSVEVESKETQDNPEPSS